MSAPHGTARARNDLSAWKRAGTAIGILTALVTVLLLAFALPQLHAGPHGIPLAVTGPSQEVGSLESRLSARQPGAFAFEQVPTAEDARRKVLDREAYGAVVIGPSGPSVMVASAGSPAVADLLKELAVTLEHPDYRPAKVLDLVPTTADDPKGAGLGAGALPLVLGGWVGAVVILLMVRGTGPRLFAGLGFAVVAGLVLIALEQYVFHSLGGSYLLTSACAALGIAATVWMLVGLRVGFGNPGLGVGAVLIVLLGNPLSGFTSAPELLPEGWGALGQFLPPGAMNSLLRSVAFFGGANSGRSVLVLLFWLVVGIGLYLYGDARIRRATQREAAQAAQVDGREGATVQAPGSAGIAVQAPDAGLAGPVGPVGPAGSAGTTGMQPPVGALAAVPSPLYAGGRVAEGGPAPVGGYVSAPDGHPRYTHEAPQWGVAQCDTPTLQFRTDG
ncbi:ABC transporter permease [Streptomyces sp. NPDC052496]|uniref:ABC transporter permease n=1 Tax=Streptomyces sp. NPDC052496 TaxID=3154951 RepID=UPI0034235C0C